MNSQNLAYQGLLHDIRSSLCGILTFLEVLYQEYSLPSLFQVLQTVREVATRNDISTSSALIFRQNVYQLVKDFFEKNPYFLSAEDCKAMSDSLSMFLSLLESCQNKTFFLPPIQLDVDDTLENRILPALTLCFPSRIQFHTQGACHSKILCHPLALFRIFSNLCNNAVDAIEVQGDVSLKWERLTRFSLPSQQPCVQFTVIDTGCGIQPELLEKVFTSGYSSKSTHKGMGLPATRSLVEFYGGSLHLLSTYHVGTSAIVTFPC